MSARVTRRGFLAVLGAGAATLVLRSAPSALVAHQRRTDAERLVSLLTHVESARAVGKAYLRAFPGEGSVAGLVDGIASGVPDGRAGLRRASDDGLRGALSASIRADFAREDSVTVRGWILSKTEARLYALAVLT